MGWNGMEWNKADRAQYMKDMLNYAKQNIETRKIVDSERTGAAERRRAAYRFYHSLHGRPRISLDRHGHRHRCADNEPERLQPRRGLLHFRKRGV